MKKLAILAAFALTAGVGYSATVTVTAGAPFLNQGFTATNGDGSVDLASTVIIGNWDGATWTGFGSETAVGAGTFLAASETAIGPGSLQGLTVHTMVTTSANAADAIAGGNYIILSSNNGATFPADLTEGGVTQFNLTLPAAVTVVTSNNASIVAGTGEQSIAFVPEPSVALLGALGVIGLLRRRR